MNIRRIDLDKGKPRNKARVFVELDVIPLGCVRGGHYLEHGVNRCEVYIDDLDRLAGEVRTKKHDQAYEQARVMCEAAQEKWLKDRGVFGKADAPELLKTQCSESPERHLKLALRMVGLDEEKGMPPFRSLRVVTRDESASIPFEEFANLSESERGDYLIDAPSTPENAADKQAEYLRRILTTMMDVSTDKPAPKARGKA